MQTEILAAILGGGIGSAIVTIIGKLIVNYQNRKYAIEDRETEDEKAIKAGVKWLLYDRIRYLGMKYIEKGEVDFDDRRILRQMHDVYHNGLDGNGDLNNIMQQVDLLPLSGSKEA